MKRNGRNCSPQGMRQRSALQPLHCSEWKGAQRHGTARHGRAGQGSAWSASLTRLNSSLSCAASLLSALRGQRAQGAPGDEWASTMTRLWEGNLRGRSGGGGKE